MGGVASLVGSGLQIETNEQGRFILEDLRGSEARITVRAIGYALQTHQIPLSASTVEI